MKKIITLLLFSIAMVCNAQTFNQITNFPDANLQLTWVFATSESTAYITAFNTQFIYQTNDGGFTWDKKQVSNVNLNFTDVYFIDVDNGWVTAADDSGVGKLFKTTDAGVTWNDVSNLLPFINNVPLSSVRFNGSNGVIGTGGGLFDVTFEAPNYYTTSDGGLSWESHVLPNPNIAFQDAFEVSRISNNPATDTFQITGAAGVSANIVYNSTDNGNTFTQVVLNSDFNNFPFGMFNVNGTVYWFPQAIPQKSTNDGLAWSSYNYPTDSFEVLSGFFDSADRGWIVGDNSKIHSTVDGGTTWTTIQNINNGILLRDINKFGSVMWAVGEVSSVYKAVDAPLSVEGFNSRKISVYPNPSSSTVTIKSNIDISEEFKLFNTLGQNVKAKTTSLLSPNKKELNLDISSLKEGIYFFKQNGTTLKTVKVIKL